MNRPRRSRRDRSATLAALGRLQSRRRDLISTNELRKTKPVLYRDLVRHFGGASAARRELGLPIRPDKPRSWTTKRLVAELRHAHRSGLTVSFWGLVRAGRRDVASAAERLAGGLAAARRLAGIPEPSRRGAAPQPWTHRTILDAIRGRVGRSLPVALTKAPPNLVTAGRRYFGSWRAAVEAAGFDYDDVRLVRQPYTKRQLIHVLRRMSTERAASPWHVLARSSIGQAARRLYGGLDEALFAAGIDNWPRRTSRAVIPSSEILRAIRARRRSGKSMRARQVWKEAHWLAYGATRRFGSWNAALEAAGIRLPDDQKWTERTIVAALRARARSGRSMKGIDVRREQVDLYSATLRHFGGYSEAARRIGVSRKQE